MSQAMEQCDNCLKMFPESKIPTHFGYCRRNIKKCADCGEMYDINFVEEHQEDFHRKEKCKHCKRQFPANDVKKHENECNHKPQFCQYCEQNVPISQYPSHLRACQSRTKNCDKCNKPITNKDYLIHISTCLGIVEEKLKPNVVPSYNKYAEERREYFAKKEEDYLPRERVQKPHQQPQPASYTRNYANQPKPEVNPISYARGLQKKDPGKDQYGINYNSKPTVNYGQIKPSNTGVTSKITTTSQRSNHAISGPGQRSSSRGANIGSNRNIKPKVEDKKQYGIKPQYRLEQPKQQYHPTSYTSNYGQKERVPDRPKQSLRPKQSYKQSYKPPQQSYKPKQSYKPPQQSYRPKQSSKLPQQQPKNRIFQKEQPKHREHQLPVYDPKNYEFDDFPQDSYPHSQQFGGIQQGQQFGGDADLNEQMMIWQSMKQKSKKPSSTMPKQFQGVDIMNESFYKDVDVEKQKAIYEDLQRKNRKY